MCFSLPLTKPTHTQSHITFAVLADVNGFALKKDGKLETLPQSLSKKITDVYQQFLQNQTCKLSNNENIFYLKQKWYILLR